MAPRTRSNTGAAGDKKANAKVRATAKGAKAKAGAEAKADAKAKADAEAKAEAEAKAKAKAKEDAKAKAAAKREEAWDVQYRELQRFYEENGHTNVPQKKKKKKKRGENDEGEDSTGGEDSTRTEETEDPSLAKLRNWVKKQRDSYAKLQRGETSPLTQARIDRLGEIGFVFDVYGDKWNAQLEKLKEYVAVFENCDVPVGDSDYGDLGRWVKLQRENHRDWQKGKTSPMTKEREAALEALGFKCELNKRTKGAAPNTASASADSRKQVIREV